jgi:4'-phosphopantetheinyl transferase
VNLIRFEPTHLKNLLAPAFSEPQDVHLWILKPEALEGFSEKRSALREILSLYTGISSAKILFEIQGEGKPQLSPTQNPNQVRFNLSHSGDMQVIAVTRAGEIGVDIEKIRPFERLNAFTERFFYPSEKEKIENAPPAKKLEVFFSIWTAKEAWAKARGESVFRALARYEWTPEDQANVPIELGPGYRGHVALSKSEP